MFCGISSSPELYASHREDVGVESTNTLTHFLDIMLGIDELTHQKD